MDTRALQAQVHARLGEDARRNRQHAVACEGGGTAAQAPPVSLTTRAILEPQRDARQRALSRAVACSHRRGPLHATPRLRGPAPCAMSSPEYHERKNCPYGESHEPSCDLKKPVSCGRSLYLGERQRKRRYRGHGSSRR